MHTSSRLAALALIGAIGGVSLLAQQAPPPAPARARHRSRPGNAPPAQGAWWGAVAPCRSPRRRPWPSPR